MNPWSTQDKCGKTPRVARELSQQEGNAGAGGHGSCPWGAPGNHTQCAASCLPTGPLLGDEDLKEPLVRRQGSHVSMHVARRSVSLFSSHGRGLGPWVTAGYCLPPGTQSPTQAQPHLTGHHHRFHTSCSILTEMPFSALRNFSSSLAS